MKKLLSIVLSLALLMSVATGCSKPAPSGSTPTTDIPSGEKPADLKWDGYEDSIGLSGSISYMHWGDDYERQMYADLIEAYQNLVPGVKIEQLYTPGDYYTKLQTLAASKTLPDVFWINEARVKEFGDAGLTLDLANTI